MTKKSSSRFLDDSMPRALRHCRQTVFAVIMTLNGGAAVAQNPAVLKERTLGYAADFLSIADRTRRSRALFEEAGKVIQSPRCLNCHPVTDRPTQTDRMTPHQPEVRRGPGGMGPVGGLDCRSCHPSANYEPSGVPGDPEWSLAPAMMAWQGKSLDSICAQMKDPRRNGGRTLAGIVEHMSHDGLVGWAWHPGGQRTPALGTQAQFGALIAAWVSAGAACPRHAPR